MGGISGGIMNTSSAAGSNAKIIPITIVTLNLGSWNKITHNAGTTYSATAVTDIQFVDSSGNNIALENWQKVTADSSKVKPAGSGTLLNVIAYVYYY